MTDSVKNANPIRGRSIPHVVSACQYIFQCFESASEHKFVLDLLSELALFLDSCGQSKDKITVERFILRKRQAWYGKDHPDTLGSMNNLASTLGDVGELQEALSMQRETIRKMTEVVGDKHPYTIVSRRCLQQIEAKVEELLRP